MLIPLTPADGSSRLNALRQAESLCSLIQAKHVSSDWRKCGRRAANIDQMEKYRPEHVAPSGGCCVVAPSTAQ